MKNYMISCDWGTSEFRLRLINIRDNEVVSGITSKDGALSVHNRWMASQRECNKKEFYQKVLLRHLDVLLEGRPGNFEDVPVVISGMASSSIGMEEQPYAKLPFSLGGENAVVKFLEKSEGFPFNILLISGVSGQADVMRGEETQMVGIAQMAELMQLSEDTICIFPGTHSKHIKISKGNIVSFETYITGELFQLLSTGSVLKDSLANANNNMVKDEMNLKSFYLGIDQSGDNANLLNKLFTVRTNTLFSLLSPRENYFYLSGLLIGYEIRSLQQEIPCKIILCSGNSLFHLYQLAIERLNFGNPAMFIPPEMMDKAAFAGQYKISQCHHQLK